MGLDRLAIHGDLDNCLCPRVSQQPRQRQSLCLLTQQRLLIVSLLAATADSPSETLAISSLSHCVSHQHCLVSNICDQTTSGILSRRHVSYHTKIRFFSLANALGSAALRHWRISSGSSPENKIYQSLHTHLSNKHRFSVERNNNSLRDDPTLEEPPPISHVCASFCCRVAELRLHVASNS